MNKKQDYYNPFTYALAAFVLTPVAAVALVCLFLVALLIGVTAIVAAALLLVVWLAVPFVVYVETKRHIAADGLEPVAEVEDATKTAIHGLVTDLRAAATALKAAADTKAAPIAPPPAAASPAPADVTGSPAVPADGSKVSG